MNLTPLLMGVMETTGLAEIHDPWLRSLAIFAGAFIFFIFLSFVCLIALPKQRPLSPISTWKASIFLLLLVPALGAGLLIPYLLATMGVEQAISKGWLYNGWLAFLFFSSYIPGIILVWRRFRSYEAPNNTLHPDARAEKPMGARAVKLKR